MELRPVDLRTYQPDIFPLFGKHPPLLTAGNRENCNTMTIGWCQLGRVWNLPACTVFVRPERYTYEFMERQDYFTVSVLDSAHASIVADCGKRSGREVDKVAAHGLTLCYGEGDAPYFAQAQQVLVCKKLYFGDLTPEQMLDERVRSFYTKDGLHRFYVGEVRELYLKD